jgi:hypothetical protein
MFFFLPDDLSNLQAQELAQYFPRMLVFIDPLFKNKSADICTNRSIDVITTAWMIPNKLGKVKHLLLVQH